MWARHEQGGDALKVFAAYVQHRRAYASLAACFCQPTSLVNVICYDLYMYL